MKVHQYELEIKDGLPPSRSKTEYDKKMFEGKLRHIGEQIRHGQYVEGLPVGSAGKLAKIVESRGLKAIRRAGQGTRTATLYVVSPEWLSGHPEVEKQRAEVSGHAFRRAELDSE